MLSSPIIFFLSSAFLFSAAVATVPFNNTFTYVNTGPVVERPDEYGTWFRAVDLLSGSYQVVFYNTTPSEYTLAIRLKSGGWESVRHFIWEANRGKPVGENAVFSLLSNGNLVLAEANGRIAWQTNTANKGVVGLRFLTNGNMLLYDGKNNTLWQSFDYPTSTLLSDQYLKLSGPTKMVSRAPTERTADGSYSFVLEPTGLSLYYTSPVDSQRYKYFSSSKWFPTPAGGLEQVTLSRPRRNGGTYEVSLDYFGGKFILSRSKFNPAFTYLRLGSDGNLRFFIFNFEGDNEEWVEPFTVFSNNSRWASECELPSKCGSFGLCRDNKCVACPRGNAKTQTGSLLPWNEKCRTEKLKSCAAKDFYYYQLVGVEHFSSKYTQGEGPVTQGACSAKCSSNCKCQGFFYHKDTQRCWTINDLTTLVGVKSNAHVGFIKAPK